MKDLHKKDTLPLTNRILTRQPRIRSSAVLITLSLILFYLGINTYRALVENLFLLQTSQEDEVSPETETFLLDLIRSKHLTPPVSRDLPYNLSDPSGMGLRKEGDNYVYHLAILDIMKQHNISVNNGFFVECGALDGEYLSQTLELEMYSGWSGLLVEASPSKVKLLKGKQRKAWVADVCLSAEPHRKVEFIIKADQSIDWKRGQGKINPDKPEDAPVKFEGHQEYQSEGEVDCFSLYLMLKAVGVSSVDLLVLDVEGQEYNVLRTYPFHLLPIKVIGLEHLLTKNRETLVQLMKKNGYQLVFTSETDYVFVLSK